LDAAFAALSVIPLYLLAASKLGRAVAVWVGAIYLLTAPLHGTCNQLPSTEATQFVSDASAAARGKTPPSVPMPKHPSHGPCAVESGAPA